MLKLPSSELTQQFSNMWVSRALELGVGVSVEPLPSAIHRGLVTAIAGLPLRSTYVVAKWILLAQTITSIPSSEIAPSPQSRKINSLPPLVNYVFRSGKTSLPLVAFT